jgi:hypothetical protein
MGAYVLIQHKHCHMTDHIGIVPSFSYTRRMTQGETKLKREVLVVVVSRLTGGTRYEYRNHGSTAHTERYCTVVRVHVPRTISLHLTNPATGTRPENPTEQRTNQQHSDDDDFYGLWIFYPLSIYYCRVRTMKKSDLYSSGHFISVAPGRLCLFGEHQDYLNLPVIALALPLFCRIEVKPATDSSRVLSLSFRGNVKCIDLDNIPPRQEIQKTGKRDFMLSAVQEVLEDGWILPCGADCVSSSTIPLQAGCSSSSAFCVAWIQVLAALADKSLVPIQWHSWRTEPK